MQRYIDISPLSMEDKVVLVCNLIDFFDLTKNRKYREFLEIPSQNIMPLSVLDFCNYQEKFESSLVSKSHDHILNIVQKMERKNYLRHAGQTGAFNFGLEKCYYTHKEVTNIQRRGNLFLAEILGFDFLVWQTKPLIVQLVGRKENGDIHCGTGFLCTKDVIITCGHNIKDMKLDQKQTVCAQEVTILESEVHSTIDVGYIRISEKFKYTQGLAFLEPKILNEILIMGFPKIPQTKEPVLISQKGEINGFIESFDGNKYLLYSTITRPGNSGSPIFSKQGYVVGMAARDFYNNKDKSEDADVRFFAGIPTSIIIQAIKDLNSDIKLPYEDFKMDKVY